MTGMMRGSLLGVGDGLWVGIIVDASMFEGLPALLLRTVERVCMFLSHVASD